MVFVSRVSDKKKLFCHKINQRFILLHFSCNINAFIYTQFQIKLVTMFCNVLLVLFFLCKYTHLVCECAKTNHVNYDILIAS